MATTKPAKKKSGASIALASKANAVRLDLENLDWTPEGNDVWFTPPAIFDALSVDFDLDPATIPGGIPWIPARHTYSEVDDGLIQPWHGRVWLNPPYSNPRPWIQRLAQHNNGIALLPADTATSWWHDYVITARALCFIRGRLRFIRNDAGLETSARFPSVLAAWGRENGEALRSCGLGWTVIQ